MPPFRQPARLDVLLPCSVCDDQRDFRMGAENVERAIRAGVVIGDDRVYLFADVTELSGSTSASLRSRVTPISK